jgi:ABC-type uncharacterized transport system substrate-binding protein
MNRRAFMTALGVTLAAPHAVDAQEQKRIPRIGVIVPVEPESLIEPNVAAFRAALRALGYTEGRSIFVEYRYAHGKEELYDELASELAKLAVDVMVVGSWRPVLAAKKATQTIPIVGVGMGSDPVQSGLVTSLRRPGGNVTGSAWVTGDEFAGKWVELLKEAAPRIVRVGYLLDSRTARAPSVEAQNAARSLVRAARATADAADLSFQVFEVREPLDANKDLTKLNKDRRGALIVVGSLFFMAHASDIVNLAAKHRLPAIYSLRVFMDTGGLMSYGPSLADLWGRAAIYVDKILKGAKPADLPVEQPTKFELVINLKTAKALGLTIPQSLLLRADQLIE